MKFVAKSVILLLVFATLALGTRVAFCEATTYFGWDVHGHTHCDTEHSHGHDEPTPCQGDCESDLTEALLAKADPVPGPSVAAIAPVHTVLEPLKPSPADIRLLSLISEPPDGLPERFSRSFTGRFLV